MQFSTGHLLICLLSWSLHMSAATTYSVFFKKYAAHEDSPNLVPSFFKIVHFENAVDGGVTTQELQAIMGVTSGGVYTREQFLKGIERLRQKEKFLHMTFTFTPVDYKQGFVICCTGSCDWIIRSLKFSGVTSGKDEFNALYEATVGDPFLSERHLHSLEAIQQRLCAHGYKNAQVTDFLLYEPVSKTITIAVKIEKRRPFVVAAVGLEIRDSSCCFTEKDKNFLRKKVASLRKKVAKKETAEKIVGLLKLWLKGKGFVDPVVEYQETVSFENMTVQALFKVAVSGRKRNVFFGNHFFSSYQLEKMMADIAAAEVFLPAVVAAQELVGEYYKKGFWSTTVEGTEEGTEQEIFIIKEGPRASVRKVECRGAVSYDSDWIEKKFFKKFIHGRFFDEEKLDEAVRNLLTWYKQQGFWDCKIVKKEYEKYVPESTAYRLVITLEEGRQRFINSLQVDGLSAIPENLPLYSLLKKAKEPLVLSSDMLGLQQQFLMQKVRKEGYLHAHVSSKLTESGAGLDVAWVCDKGKKVLFGKTITRGFTKISYERLLKLLSYKEGEVWSRDKIQQSLATLRALQIFERVSLYPSFKNLTEEQRDTILMVKDDDPFEVKVRMGFSQVSKNFYFKKGSTYTLGASCIWKNPLSQADRLAVEVDFNRFERKVNASYKIPFFFDFPLFTIFKVYSNKYIQPVYIGSSKPLYQVLQEGFLLGVSKKYFHCDLGFTSGFEWMETTDISLQLARAINFDTALVNKKIPYYFVEPMVYVDFLDDKVNPRRGFFALASLKGMFPFKQSSFLVKILAEQGAFIPIDERAVIAMRLRAGHIFRREFKAIMPPERFFLGGPFSMRGYQQDYCPPLGSYTDDEGCIQHVPQGGKTMFNANFELRVPVKQELWTAFFQDFGVLIEDPKVFFSSGSPLACTGFGIRYMTPVGPLRFDIGWKWQKMRPEESSYAWFLTFGNAF